MSARSPAAGRGRAIALGLASLVLGMVSVPLGALPWLFVAGGRVLGRRRHARRVHQLVILGLPEAVDLARILVTAGATVSETVEVLAARAPQPFATAFTEVASEVRQGMRLAEALPAVVQAVGEPARPLVRALVAGVSEGVSVAPLLDRVRAEALRVRRHELEVASRRLPVLLLFPLVLCVLPAFVLLTVVPLLASALQNLQV
ncbi:MAG: gspF [Acidimicrobiia bacterium]|nr:gspF [Acidimicrobiia bacterium]